MAFFAPAVRHFPIRKLGRKKVPYEVDYDLRCSNEIVYLVDREDLDIVKWMEYLSR